MGSTANVAAAALNERYGLHHRLVKQSFRRTQSMYAPGIGELPPTTASIGVNS
jgi:hypothetical protein